jgi:serine/threonine protein phosphatase PrpC
MVRGTTNGDDAVLVEENLICANDGVGAWMTRPRGNAALWSRLMLHFYAQEMDGASKGSVTPDPVNCLQRAFESTKEATSKPNQWQGTTTTTSAFLHHDNSSPVLYVTNIGDSRIMVIRPSSSEIIYKTTEQWHWFDCPYQLGTNSVDSPLANAVCDKISLTEEDVVVAMTDGLSDNLWDHEIVSCVVRCLRALTEEKEDRTEGKRAIDSGGGMMWIAEELVREARKIAEDPFAESPYMERAVDEGIGYEGGLSRNLIYFLKINLIRQIR